MAVTEYLEANGPKPRSELPEKVTVADRQNCTCRFEPSSRGMGREGGGTGRSVPVYYLLGDHEPKQVVRAWLHENRRQATRMSDKALLLAFADCGDEFRAAAREYLGLSNHGHGGGSNQSEVTCPFCDAEVWELPDHLPTCEAKP